MAASTAREFVDGWSLAQILGEGAFGEVRLVINRTSGEAVAMKMVDTSKNPDAKTSVRKEVCIQKILHHPHILRLFGQRTQGNIEYIFLEYAAGGELFDRIEPDIGMKNVEAQKYFNQLLLGVDYLHKRGVAHRDLKPENLLLDDKDNLKISDFGMATMFRLKGRERLLDKRCGTLPYVAPEVLTGTYKAEPADIWSCGIILTAMLAGELPWDQPKSSCPEFVAWEGISYTFVTPWAKLNNLALSLLRKILSPTPSTRINMDNLKKHKWCTMKFLHEDARKAKQEDVVDGPPNKRFCGMPNSEDTETDMSSLSQPLYNLHDESFDADARSGISFSQPALMDDLILGTQMNLTQNTTQNVFQKLVKRMTRFFITGGTNDAINSLTSCLEKKGYTWKANKGIITVSTLDRRKMNLVFKANIIDMDGKLMIDFRLSKGCGLEFKRRFLDIKSCLSDIIVKVPMGWPSVT